MLSTVLTADLLQPRLDVVTQSMVVRVWPHIESEYLVRHLGALLSTAMDLGVLRTGSCVRLDAGMWQVGLL